MVVLGGTLAAAKPSAIEADRARRTAAKEVQVYNQTTQMSKPHGVAVCQADLPRRRPSTAIHGLPRVNVTETAPAWKAALRLSGFSDLIWKPPAGALGYPPRPAAD
jgi:hypothetical protein